MKCKVCQSEAEKAFNKTILFKYDVDYFQCKKCGFLFTEEPYWLGEAYEESLKGIRDTGMVQRNMLLADFISRIIVEYFNVNSKFIDYGAGTGLLVRTMRDRGFDFYYDDPYARNIFARCFEARLPVKIDERNELLTAIEVFEHSADPMIDIENMFKYSDSIFFTTELQPKNASGLEDWAYLLPEAGQHVSFYTLEALESIAENFSAKLYSDGQSLHLLTRRSLPNFAFTKNQFRYRVMRWLGRKLQVAAGVGLINGCLINEDHVHVNNTLKKLHTKHAN